VARESFDGLARRLQSCVARLVLIQAAGPDDHRGFEDVVIFARDARRKPLRPHRNEIFDDWTSDWT
jgi:hypothetical protein